MKKKETLSFLQAFLDYEREYKIDDLLREKLGVQFTEIRYRTLLMKALLNGVFHLCQAGNYYCAYVLHASLSECYIDVMFVLREDTDNRSKELISANKQLRKPFDGKERGKCRKIKGRAKAIGQPEFYNTTYESLCKFKHPTIQSYIAFEPNNKKFEADNIILPLHSVELYTEVLEGIGNKFGISYPTPIIRKISDTKDLMKQILKDREVK